MSLPIKLNKESIKTLVDTYFRGANEAEIELFLNVANRTGLDPFARQIFLVKRWDSGLGRESMTPQTSVDGLRLIAERSGKYEGQTAPEWCGKDGKWRDVWLEKDYPAAARIGVYKAGHKVPTYAIARWDSYCAKKKDGSVTQFWAKMPDLMLAKCAESLALRKSFPNETSGIYSQEEMSQANSEIDVTPPDNKKLLPPTPPPPKEENEPKFEDIPPMPSPKITAGNYIRKAGKTDKGKRLVDIKMKNHQNFLEWCAKSIESGKPITGILKDDMDATTEWVKLGIT